MTAISKYCLVTKDYVWGVPQRDQIHIQARDIRSILETGPEIQQPFKPPAAGQV